MKWGVPPHFFWLGDESRPTRFSTILQKAARTGWAGRTLARTRLSLLGNLLTHYRYRLAKVSVTERPGELEINVSGGCGGASSFLNQTGETWESSPDLQFIGRERVRVTTIDRAASQYYSTGDRLFLKIDVQGYERKVLEGASDTMPRIVGLRMELSISQFYEGEPPMQEMLDYVYGLGFRLCAIDEAWSDPRTREVFQMDGVFFRVSAL